MKLSFQIALRFLKWSTAPRAVKAMTLVSLLGIAISVATLAITLSVANGFGDAYRQGIMNFSAHVVVAAAEEIPEYRALMSRLEDYRLSAPERASWQRWRPVYIFSQFLQDIWQRIDEYYLRAVFEHPPGGIYLKTLETLHPQRSVDFLARHQLYSEKLKNSAQEMLQLAGKGVVALNPFVYREGLLLYRGQLRGVVIKGVDPTAVKDVGNMQFDLAANAWPRPAEGGVYPVMLGEFLARELKIAAGDKIKIMLPAPGANRGNVKFETFAVAGTFKTGMYDYDSQFVLLDLGAAQRIFAIPGAISGVELRLDDPEKAEAVAARIEQDLGYPFSVATYKELNRSLFAAIKLERLMFVIIMGAFIVVAAFNIISTIMLRILYKTSDISILRALGVATQEVKKVFVWQGMLVGLAGTVIGLVGGILCVYFLRATGGIIIPPEIYLINRLPVCFSKISYVMIAAFSLLISLLTSYLAARKATEIKIVAGLHRE